MPKHGNSHCDVVLRTGEPAEIDVHSNHHHDGALVMWMWDQCDHPFVDLSSYYGTTFGVVRMLDALLHDEQSLTTLDCSPDKQKVSRSR